MAVALVFVALLAVLYATASWDRRALRREEELGALMRDDRQEMLRIARASLSLVGLSALETSQGPVRAAIEAEWARARAALEAAAREPLDAVDMTQEERLLRELFEGDVVFRGSADGRVTPESAAWVRQYLRARVMASPTGEPINAQWRSAQLTLTITSGDGHIPDEVTGPVFLEWERRLDAVSQAAPVAGVALVRLGDREIARLRAG